MLFIKNVYIKRRKIKVITAISFAIIFFIILFPGINDILWNKYDIMNKVWVRLMDLQIAGINVFSIPFVSELQTILMDERYTVILGWYDEVIEPGNYVAYTMISLLYRYWFIGIIVFFGFIVWCIKFVKLFLIILCVMVNDTICIHIS